MLKKIFITYIAISILLFMALGYLVAEKSSASIKEEILNTAQISMDDSYRYLENMISSARKIALDIATSAVVQEGLQNYMISGKTDDLTDVESYLKGYPGVSSVYNSIRLYIDKEVDGYERIQSYENNADFEKTLTEPGAFVWTSVSDGNEIVLRQMKAIFSNSDYNSILAIVVVDTNVNSMRPIAQAAMATGNRLYLVSGNGEILYPHYNYDHISEPILTKGEDNVYEEGNHIVIVKTNKETGWSLIKVVSVEKINSRTDAIKQTIRFLAVAFTTVSALVGVLFISYFLKPVTTLADKMAKVKTGHLEKIDGKVFGETAVLYDSYNYMIDRINTEIESNYKSKIKEKDAELKALQAQINPHFLYNTLDSIYWLAIRHKADDIAKMVLALSDMFRLSLNKGKNILKVKDEIRQVDSYISLQRVRYSNSFDVKYEIDDNVKERKMLKMLLQPIVENAIVHGFEETPEGNMIYVRVKDMADATYFEVINNGKPIDSEEIKRYLNQSDDSEIKGYGIRNVNERIKALYGDEYGITYDLYEGMTRAKFTIPLEDSYENSDC